MEVAARTNLPVRSRAVVNFRWGVRVPAELKTGDNNQTAGIAFQKIPFLVMNKIGIEHVDGGDSKKTTKAGPDSALPVPANVDVAEACFGVKRQLEVLQAENGLLKKAVEDLRREFAAGSKSFSPAGESTPGKYRDVERNGNKGSGGKSDRRNGENEERKKALMGATGA
jgi:hypothetical protein